jgi:hypothetical protein
VVTLKLGTPGRTLMDGNTSWDAVADQAVSTWNSHLGTIQFSPVTQNPGMGSDGDRANQVFFSTSVYGESFGGLVMAVSTVWHDGTTTTESDVVFNAAASWDSYRGPARRVGGKLLCDFFRIALHEFGHVLGLDHPDQAGQSVNAIMNSRVSDLDSLTADDVLGAQALYPPSSPVIIVQPRTESLTPGGRVTFSVTATGSVPMTYQWERDGGDISSATNASYTIANVEAEHAGAYTVVISNAGGSVTSMTAVLTVIGQGLPPQITSQPQNATAKAGEKASFNVAATGAGPLRYQWRFADNALPGQTNSTLIFLDVQPENAGDYSVVIADAQDGSATSRAATLTVVAVTLRFEPAGSRYDSHGLFQLKLTGLANRNQIIQASTDLVSWVSLATNRVANGWLDFTDTNLVGSSTRFYRALLAP